MAFQKALIRSFTIIIGSLLLAGILLAWLRYDIDTQSSKAYETRIRANKEANLAITLATLRTQAEAVQRYEERLASLIPAEDSLIDFRKYLEALASQRRVVVSFAFEGATKPEKDDIPGTAGFNLEMSGSLSGIKGLLEDIEVKPRAYLLSFDSFDLSKIGEGYRVVLRGQLFYRNSINNENTPS